MEGSAPPISGWTACPRQIAIVHRPGSSPARRSRRSAREFGKKDHTTACTRVDKIADMMDADEAFRNKIRFDRRANPIRSDARQLRNCDDHRTGRGRHEPVRPAFVFPRPSKAVRLGTRHRLAG